MSQCNFQRIGAAVLTVTLSTLLIETAASADSIKPRVVVLTDIGADVDDQQSLVRLLVYSNEIEIEGLTAATSVFQPSTVQPALIEERVRAYGRVRANLLAHAKGYPTMTALLGRIHSGSPVLGMSGVGEGKETAGSQSIIAAVDRRDSRPLWVSIWGGAADLAQALWTVRATRSKAGLDRFVSRLRVYAISDQDEAGPWIRSNFPQIFWIGQPEDVQKAAQRATWLGISVPYAGSSSTTVSKAWLETYIRSKGPLGAVYPASKFITEGDTPAFLALIGNGLGNPERPDWGSWGGRYVKSGGPPGLWSQAADTLPDGKGGTVTSDQATIWRWRDAYQSDFAARMEWSVSPRRKDGNQPPVVKLNGVGGDAPLTITACAGQVISLTANGSIDPDHQPLNYRWWQYREAGGAESPSAVIANASSIRTSVALPLVTAAHRGYQIHIVLEVTAGGAVPITRYRRAIITAVNGSGRTASGRACL